MPTQQVDLFEETDGSDLNAKGTWFTFKGGVDTAGLFLFYNTANKAASNNSPGVYHKPPVSPTGPETGTNLPRALLNGVGSILSETKVALTTEVRVSGNPGWGGGAGGSNVELVLIGRASGTAYASDAWYELGITDMDSTSTGKLVIRRVKAGTTTTLIGPKLLTQLVAGFAFPNATTGKFSKLEASIETVGSQVLLSVSLTVDTTTATLSFADTSVDRITASGYGGIAATGTADGGGTLWCHFKKFLLTVNQTGQGQDDVQDPDEVTDNAPALEADPTLSNLAVAGEGTAVSSLTPEPDLPVETETRYETSEIPTDAGYVVTHPRFANARRILRLRWTNRSQTDESAFRAFFDSHKAGNVPFTWTPPEGSSTKWIFLETDLASEYVDIAPAGYGSRVRSWSAVVLEVF